MKRTPITGLGNALALFFLGLLLFQFYIAQVCADHFGADYKFFRIGARKFEHGTLQCLFHDGTQATGRLIGSAPVLQNAAETSVGVSFAVNGDASGWVEYATSPDLTGATKAFSGEHGLMTVGPLAGWLIVAAFVLFVAAFAVGPGVCVWLVMTELMPLRLRAGGLMVAQFVAMGVSYVLAQTFLPWSQAFGNSSVFLTLAVVSVGYVVTAAFFLPETKGMSLESIERMFAKKGEK